MNSLIRHQKTIFNVGYNSPIGLSNKYTRPYYRSFITRRSQFEKLSYTHLGQCVRPSITTSHVSENRDTQYATLYAHDPFTTQRRSFVLSSRLLEQSSSKVEETVKSIKNKQKEQEDELKKENGQVKATTSEISKSAVVKKPLKTRIWEEIVHYYHGFRLLFVDINICRKLLGRVLNGKTLTRRENKLLVRTTSDLFRLIPFSIFIIVPFMELLLPVFIKFFPGMLPSTFQTAKERENKLKQSLQVRLEMAKFLQKTLDQMSVQHNTEHKSEDAKSFAEFFRKIKDPSEFVANEEIIKFSKQFEDEITLDSLSRDQLVALCRVLEQNTMGTTNFLRFQLRLKLRSVAADDRVIAREGVDALDLFELQQACKTRGMRAYGLSAEKLRSQLQEWIDLSLNEKVPNTLLLLSRALMIADEAPTSEKLKEIIRVLPDALGAQTKAAIGEREGKIDNKTKIEIIKEEERKIKEERDEEREDEKQKAEMLLDSAPVIDESKETTTEQFLDPKPVIAMKQTEVIDTHISSKDVEMLGVALNSVIGANERLLVEKETIRDLKEEIEDYKEDIEELKEITTMKTEEIIRESRGAKILFKKVNSMIGQLDKVLNDLEQKGKQLQASTDPATSAEQLSAAAQKPDALVRVDELINAIKLMQKTSDEAKLKTIEKVLSKIDDDRDGSISANEILKVMQTIGKENVNLSEKQVDELLDLLDKEEIIEAEVKVEKAIAKSIKEADNAMKVAEEIQDMAPLLNDNAKDLSAGDEKNILVDKLTQSDKEQENTKLQAEAADKQKDKILPPTGISSTLPPTIPPLPTTPTQDKPKDKML